jgi:hypothetical protein
MEAVDEGAAELDGAAGSMIPSFRTLRSGEPE